VKSFARHGGSSRSQHSLVSRGAIFGALVLFLSACNRGVLDPVGPVAAAEKQILINSTAIMLAIIIPTMIATVAIAFWFRRGNKKATYLPDWEYSGAVEMVVWGIPVLTIMLLGGITWIGSHALDPSKPLDSPNKPINVQVVSLDWKWLFIYPDQGVATVNQLVVPAGTPVNFQLTSATVWNVFWVPQMGTMIYTMPRMSTRLNLQADRQGVFEGTVGTFQRRRIPGDAVQGAFGAATAIRRLGAVIARRRAGARQARLRRTDQAQQLCETDDLQQRRARPVRRNHREQGAAAAAIAAQPGDNRSGGWAAC
jgi:cytochrome o ubiquinol oxidase subunit 2